MKKKLLPIAVMILFAASCGCSDSSVDENKGLSEVKQPIVNGSDYSNYEQISNAAVAIVLSGHPSYSDQVLCTGTLISPKHILTAAHCVADLHSTYMLMREDAADPGCKWTAGYVSAGGSELLKYMKINFGRMSSSRLGQHHDIRKVVYHSGYSQIANSAACTDSDFDGYTTILNDIAILELASPVSEDVAKPVPILPPWLGISQKMISDGIKVTFLGFGYDEKGFKGIQNGISLPLEMYCDGADSDLCQYGKTIHVKGCHPHRATCRKLGEQDYFDSKVSMPARSLFYLQSKGGPCSGDSGGPAYVFIGKQYYVAGISSYGDNSCIAYGVSTAVQDYYDWILKNAPEAGKSIQEVCGNGYDDNNNGLTDQFDPACEGMPYCGDGIVNGTEDCEGDMFLNDLTLCSDWNYKYESGNAKCNSNCTINYDDCVEFEKPDTCGDGEVQEGEQCDGDILISMFREPMEGRTCSEFSSYFTNGTISCDDNCITNIEECVFDDQFTQSICGDGVIDNGEMCDSNKFAGGMSNFCTSWSSDFSGGTVSCSRNCEVDMSECVEVNVCGDGILTDDELCDGKLFTFDEKTCEGWSHRFNGGEVLCNSNCTIDYSKCTQVEKVAQVCGNGVLDTVKEDGKLLGNEDCDGDVFAKGTNCHDWDERFSDGTVSCTDNCTVNLEKCLMAENAEYVDNYGFDSLLTLEKQKKPEEKAPKKEEDTVSILISDSSYLESWAKSDDNPDNPENPDNPDNPENPDNPVNPVNPENPDNPENPVNPDNPTDPEKTTDPMNPAEPEQNDFGSGGCSSMPYSGTQDPLWLLICAGVLGLRKRRNGTGRISLK